MKIREAIGLIAAALIGTILLANTLGQTSDQKNDNRKIKMMVFGVYSDEPETGCGGGISLFVNAGHSVYAVYLTRGEAGKKGKSHSESAQIRMKKAFTKHHQSPNKYSLRSF